MNHARTCTKTRLIRAFMFGALVAFAYEFHAEQQRAAAKRARKARRRQRIDALKAQGGIEAWLKDASGKVTT